jgi:hypothetical protein
MIKKSLSVLFLITALSCFALCKCPNYSSGWNYHQDTIKTKRPQVFIRMHHKNFETDSLPFTLMDTIWIKKEVVLKNEKYKNLYDSPIDDAVILIYIKPRYYKQVKELMRLRYN